MGVPYLIYRLEDKNARLPLKLPFDVGTGEKNLRRDLNVEKYRQIGEGNLKSIGIDGSVFLHSHIVTDQRRENWEENDDENFILSSPSKKRTEQKDENLPTKRRKMEPVEQELESEPADRNVVDVESSVRVIVNRMLQYVNIICKFFSIFNSEKNRAGEPAVVILHLVIDGKSPITKNRKEVHPKHCDSYSLMSLADKMLLHHLIIGSMRTKVEDLNDNREKMCHNYRFIFISNEGTPFNTRPEGEIALFSLSTAINRKHNNDSAMRHVMVSSDSDLTAITLLRNDPTIVIVNPPQKSKPQMFISNHRTISDGLALDSRQLIMYTTLHFLLFGSDYSLGLMNCPNESKKKVILEAVKRGDRNLNEICGRCIRRGNETEMIHKNDLELLEMLKQKVVQQGLNAIMYYKSLGNNFYLTRQSPQLYHQREIKRFTALLSFTY